MVIGVLKLELSINEVYSLKEKRHIVKSIVERLKARYNVSVAEVDLNDKWKKAVIGVAHVSNEAQYADKVLSNIAGFVERDGRAILEDYSIEIIHV